MRNVLPHVAEGIIRVSRERMADPLQWMADFLQMRGQELQSYESRIAHDKFRSYMSLAEEMETKVTARLNELASKRGSSN